METLEVLAGERYVETKTAGEGIILFLRVTVYGFGSYARTYLPEYDSLFKSVALQIVNHERRSSEEIAQALDQPHAVVDYILNELRARGYINAQELGDGQLIIIFGPTVRLRRWLQEL